MTSTALATVNQDAALATTDAVLSREQIDLLKKTICYGASDAEFELFIGFCRRVKLDPFSKQVHFVPRRAQDPRTGAWVERREPMIAIDGFRVIAERSGRYEGQTAPQWCGADGKWVDVWLSEAAPAAARVGIYRAGFREPIYQPASYLSYVQETKDGGPTKTWKKMPDVMLSKCAEALALRKAFPHDLSGVYAPEEMAQSVHGEDFIDVVAQQSSPPAAPTVAEGASALAWKILNDRLKAVAGYVGDDKETKMKRRAWWMGALGYQDVGPKWNAVVPYQRSDADTKAHVLAQLEALERAAVDDVPDFPSAEKFFGNDTECVADRVPGADDEEG